VIIDRKIKLSNLAYHELEEQIMILSILLSNSNYGIILRLKVSLGQVNDGLNGAAAAALLQLIHSFVRTALWYLKP